MRKSTILAGAVAAAIALCSLATTTSGASTQAVGHDPTQISTPQNWGIDRGGLGRTGWYPNEPGLSPAAIKSPNFRLLKTVKLNGAVNAQPLVIGPMVYVETEQNWAYGIDAITGAIRWHDQLGPKVDNVVDPTISCLAPPSSIGIMSTPVVDFATNTEYLISAQPMTGGDGPFGFKVYAINLEDGTIKPGFPVTISGQAQNDPGRVFVAHEQYQRAGLILVNGRILATFSSHCDQEPYGGWIASISARNPTQQSLWAVVSEKGRDAGGIWQTGAGIVSDSANSILVASGNGNSDLTTNPVALSPAARPGTDLSESVTRLSVGADGTLTPQDFYKPVDAQMLDKYDFDAGTGAPILLPQSFGSPTHRQLTMLGGKEGYITFLDAKHLGGLGQGVGHSDNYLGRIGNMGGDWSTPTAWSAGAAGNYLYNAATYGIRPNNDGALQAIKVSSGADGVTANVVGTSAMGQAYGSGSPIVTSNGSVASTGVVWQTTAIDGFHNDELVAYNPIPVNGVLQPIRKFPMVGIQTFTPPGVGNGRIYVGGWGGFEIFGLGVTPAGIMNTASAPVTVAGSTSTVTATFQALRPLTLSGITMFSPTSGGKAIFGVQPMHKPVVLKAGALYRFSITFAPTHLGSYEGTLNFATTEGIIIAMSDGQAVSNSYDLISPQVATSLPVTAVGSPQVFTVNYTNVGTAPAPVTSLRLSTVAQPTDSSPFSIIGETVPAGGQIAPGATEQVSVKFAPTRPGLYVSAVALGVGSTINWGRFDGNAAPIDAPKVSVTSLSQLR